MAQVITFAGEQLFATKAQNNQPLDIDTFIFAMVPGQDPNAPINRAEALPPIGQRVHTQIVQQFGKVNDNVVIYSTVLDSTTGPFEFNWVGLYSSVNNILVAIQHIPTTPKTITVPGAAGNTLNRNFGIEYSGIAELAGITVEPETWQLDYTARLNGMDELTRQLAADMNGKDWFIGDGFKVEPRSTLNTFKVTAGAGYVSGLRVELETDHILALSSYPQFVYVDAWFDGTSESVWKGHVTFTVSITELNDYIDVNGRPHYVIKIARISSFEDVEDLRTVDGVYQKLEKHIERTTRYFDSFLSLKNSTENLTKYKKVGTNQHSIEGIGGTTYVKDGTEGEPNTGNEAKFYDVSGNGWANESRSVLTMGAVTGDIASNMMKSLDEFDCVYIPNRKDYVHGAATVVLKEGQVINAENPLITSDGINFNTFILAPDIKRWAILGSLNYEGSLDRAEDIGDEIGLLIRGCENYRVEKFVVRKTRSHGFKIEAGTISEAPRGDQGQIDSCAAYECRVGAEVEADTSAEFNQFYNFNTAGCLDALIIGAGNTSFVGGNCVDNTRGITVVGGYNHAHGIISSMNINHNQSYSIKFVSVTNGHTVQGCHLYGNGGTSSPIWFVNSKGCSVKDGAIDCPIYNDGNVGQNAIINNFIAGNSANLLGGNPQGLRVSGNWTVDGAWDFNDPASEYSLVNRGASNQSIPDGTDVIFNNPVKDKRSAVDLILGIYNAPIDATYNIQTDLKITGAFTNNEFLELVVNGVVRSHIPAVMIKSDTLIATFSTSSNLVAGDEIKIRSRINASRSPVLSTGSQLQVSVMQ